MPAEKKEEKVVVPTKAEVALAKAEKARDARVAKVKADVETARVSREKLQKDTGLVEGEGAKADREALEATALAEASEVRVVELIEGTGGSELMNTIIATVNQLASIENGRK